MQPGGRYLCYFPLVITGRLQLLDLNGSTIAAMKLDGTAIVDPYTVAGAGSVWHVIGANGQPAGNYGPGGKTVVTYTTQAAAITAATSTTGFNASREHISFPQTANNCRVTNGTIIGANVLAGTGTAAYDPNHEHQHGVAVHGATNIEIDHLSVVNVFGDFRYIAPATDGTIATDIYTHDIVGDGNGRMGLSVVGGWRIRDINNTIRNVRQSVVDVEPNGTGPSNEVHHYLNQGMTVGPFRLNMLSAVGSAAPMDDIVVDSFILIDPGSGGLGGTMKVQIGVTGIRRTNFAITNGTTPVSYSQSSGDSPMGALNIDGLIVTGNRQPLHSPTTTILTATTCTGVVSSPNTLI